MSEETYTEQIKNNPHYRSFLFRLSGVDQGVVRVAGAKITNERLKDIAFKRWFGWLITEKPPKTEKVRNNKKGRKLTNPHRHETPRMSIVAKFIRFWKLFDELEAIKRESVQAGAESRRAIRECKNVSTSLEGFHEKFEKHVMGIPEEIPEDTDEAKSNLDADKEELVRAYEAQFGRNYESPYA